MLCNTAKRFWGFFKRFWGNAIIFGGIFGKIPIHIKVGFIMRKKNYKGRCEKRSLSKSKEVCRTYDPIQYHYADVLQAREDIAEFRLNVDIGNGYMTDFVCTKTDGTIFVRECVNRKHLTKPLTVSLLDVSREFWLQHNMPDWGIVINDED